MDVVLNQPDDTTAPTGPRASEYEIILVTYRSRPLVESLLARLPVDLPIAIVDNSRGDDRIDDLARGRSGTRYLLGPARGFGSAANLGVRTSEREVVIFLNPDCSPSPEQLAALVGELRSDPELALVGMTTMLADGSMEMGVGGWEPTFRRAAAHALGLHKLFPRIGLWARPERGEQIDLDWLGAACMAAPRDVFLRLGGFDESYFVYNEDVELGRAIRGAGLRQKLVTDLVVHHVGGGSGDAKPRMLRMRGAMMMQYVARHNGHATTHGLRLALTAGYVGRYLLCWLRRRRSVAHEHAAYLRGLWFGPPASV
jgi:N-acetylglucosaminyl-diphospho-decaprenol L-rhamnosyltransferase